jgi:predicted RNA-binding protein associated with RNAse of E/G family
MIDVPRPVTVRYRRLPNRIARFQGTLLEESRERLVIEHHVRTRNPRRVFGKVVIANGYRVVWFVFKGRWYDIGKFYDQKGVFTGYYCDIIRPVARLLSSPAETSIITDLFLDLWIDRAGRCVVLDEDELERALVRRTISVQLARKARIELKTLIRLTKLGRFPGRAVKRFKPAMNRF